MHSELQSLLRSLLSVEQELQTASVDAAKIPVRDTGRFVSRGLPWIGNRSAGPFLDDRLYMFSQSVPDCRKLSLASSRLGRRLDLETWWFDLLRTAVLHCHEADELLLTAEGTATCEAVRRAGELFGKPRLHFRPLGKGILETDDAILQWLIKAMEYLDLSDCGDRSASTIHAIVSPPLNPSLLPAGIDGRTSLSERLGSWHIPVADQLLVGASDRTYVISLRMHGHLERLLAQQLQMADRTWQSILIASDVNGQLPDAARALPSGWIPWLVEAGESQLNEISSRKSNRPDNAQDLVTQCGYSIPTLRRSGSTRGPVRDPIASPEEWLLHWTRPATGPWPDETPDDYLDALILRTGRAQRSALATLLRIGVDGILRGSSTGIRGGHSVVSLTAVPLSEFRRRRTFRNHLHRFDFEPWGIGFRRSAIAALAREVIYGTESDWLKMADNERPFFQKATTSGATNNVAEREWRVRNELVFRHLSVDDVCLFAPTQQDAEILAQHCRWGIVVTPS